MKIHTAILILLALFLTQGTAQPWDAQTTASVEKFIQAIQQNDTTYLKNNVSYPLYRSYPLTSIQNEQQFVDHYLALFDDSLKTALSNSNIERDWTVVGSQGVMFDQGTLWLDMQGQLLRINYETALEQSQRQHWIKQDKAQLHPSLQDYESPILSLTTKKYKVRIDALANERYRYASWPVQAAMSIQPDLIVKNGRYEQRGTGGNHSYIFTNGIYDYEVAIHVIGTGEEPDASLIVNKNNKEIWREDAVLVPPMRIEQKL